LITVLVTLASLTSASVRRYPDFSAAQWHAVLFAHLPAVEAGAPILLGLWLGMAMANAMGQDAARVAFAVVYGIITPGFSPWVSQLCSRTAQAAWSPTSYYCTSSMRRCCPSSAAARRPFRTAS
jgi:hypothetical protein